MSIVADNDQEAVTVVIPTHNRAQVLCQTLESIAAQEDASIEIVVVDDASTDETPEVLSQFPQISVIRNDQPTEQRKARNDGAKLAGTPWLAFCDDDDLWAPNKLRRQLDAAKARGASWCTASALYIDERLRPLGGHRLSDPDDVDRRIPVQNVVPGGGSGVLVSKALFDEVGGFREDAKYVEDWDLWIRLSRAGVVACVDELLVAQRKWPRSYSHKDLAGQNQAFEDTVRRYGGDAGSSSERPIHAGSFELQQRLETESRWSIVKDLPRIMRQSPESWQWALATLTLSREAIRRLRVRKLGQNSVADAQRWLARYT